MSKGTCEWCDKGWEPVMLDEDGVMIEVSGNPGTLSHAYDDAWWPCKKSASTAAAGAREEGRQGE